MFIGNLEPNRAVAHATGCAQCRDSRRDDACYQLEDSPPRLFVFHGHLDFKGLFEKLGEFFRSAQRDALLAKNSP